MKSSPSIWHLLHNVKLTVKISSIFVAFLENMNFLTFDQIRSSIDKNVLKFMYSKKATQIDEIFTVDLTLCSRCQIVGEDFINFCGLL